MQKYIVSAALEECVHIAGVMKFLRQDENAGWRSVLAQAGWVYILYAQQLKKFLSQYARYHLNNRWQQPVEISKRTLIRNLAPIDAREIRL